MIYNGKKKSVYKAVYMYKSVFMFFGKGDEQLALDADSVVCRKEEGGAPPPLLSLWHTALSPRSCLEKKSYKTKQKRWQGELGIQAEALSMLYFLWVESKVNLLVSLLRLLPSNLPKTPSFLPSFLLGPVMTLFPPCCGVTGLQRLALAASPVDTVVMSLPPGSTIGHPRPPQWAASLVYSVGEWGG